MISADYVRQLDPAEAESNAAKLREMKGSRVLNLQQQACLPLASRQRHQTAHPSRCVPYESANAG